MQARQNFVKRGWLWMNRGLGTTPARSRLVACPVPGRVGRISHAVGMPSLTRAEIGALGEQLAADHLDGLGLNVLARNWRCRYGELDLIATEPSTRTVVFVEVKTRTSDQFGGLEQAVTPQKVRRLRRLAALWLAEQETRWAAIRIDVIGVRIGRRRVPEIAHIQGVG